MPNTHGLRQAIIENLQHLNFETIDISYNEDLFKYQNSRQKIINLLYKTFLNSKSYKNQLKFQQLGSHIEHKISTLSQPADYALLFRADIYPKDVLSQIKSASHKIINYQWDGMDRFPDIFSRIELFDRFFVFDPADAKKYPKPNILTTTNFYFDFIPENPQIQPTTDFIFRGTYLRERMPVIQTFIDHTQQLNLSTDIKIFYEKPHAAIPAPLYTQQPTPYLQYLQQLQHSRYLVDFNNSTHDGLSFRIFESIKMRKKLIINNKYQIQKYDFYHPNNIHLWDGKNLQGLQQFLQTPYTPLPQHIEQKYSFTNWIRYILDIPPYQSLDPAL